MTGYAITILHRPMNKVARLNFMLDINVTLKTYNPLVCLQAVLVRISTCMALIAFTAYNGLMKELTL